MAKRVSPTAIGVFVVASFALVVAAIIVVGVGNLFQKPLRFICVFQGDLNGLKVGAPVKFKGVQIGTVAEIRLRLAPSQGELLAKYRNVGLPVIVDLDDSQVREKGGTGEAGTPQGFTDFLDRGLRAQLRTESFLTGLLYVDVDLHPHTPANFAVKPGTSPYREIPTIPTKLEAVQEDAARALAKFDSIDFQALVVSLTDAAKSIKTLTSSPQITATLASLDKAAVNLNGTLTSVRLAVDNVNGRFGPLVENLRRNSDEVNLTLNQTRAALTNLQESLEPDSPLLVRLNQALEQLTSTSRSVGELTDYLQENPSSLVRGRYVPEKDR